MSTPLLLNALRVKERPEDGTFSTGLDEEIGEGVDTTLVVVVLVELLVLVTAAAGSGPGHWLEQNPTQQSSPDSQLLPAPKQPEQDPSRHLNPPQQSRSD